MINAEVFKQIFGIYATELWAMSESEFLEWLNAKHIATESKSKDGWISCDERLPDKGLRVLMQLNNAWQIVGWYDIEDAQWFELIYAEPVANDRVLAWMELPPDYKGDIE